MPTRDEWRAEAMRRVKKDGAYWKSHGGIYRDLPMTDKQDQIREIHEYVAAHGGENTATHLLVQAAVAISEQAAKLEAVGAGGVQSYVCGHRPPCSECATYAVPQAAPGVGNSGFDHKTAADFLNGKTVSDEAVRAFVAASRWAHDERAALSATLLAMHGVLTSREAEIALLKQALLEAETATQPAPAPLSEREEFERDWEKRHAPVPINSRTHDDGRYGDSSIQDAWESWQARAALAAQGGR